MLTITTNKKSQMEIIGLVIIVILISLALLFVLQFSLKKPVSVKKSYTHATVASNEINALIKSNTNCSGRTMIAVSDLLKDCALYHRQNGYMVCDNGMKSCEFLDNTVDDILDKTLRAWGKDFKLTAIVSDTIVINKTGGTAQAAREVEMYPLQIPGMGIMFINLEIYG